MDPRNIMVAYLELIAPHRISPELRAVRELILARPFPSVAIMTDLCSRVLPEWPQGSIWRLVSIFKSVIAEEDAYCILAKTTETQNKSYN